jgi:hypothetical protein
MSATGDESSSRVSSTLAYIPAYRTRRGALVFTVDAKTAQLEVRAASYAVAVSKQVRRGRQCVYELRRSPCRALLINSAAPYTSARPAVYHVIRPLSSELL